MRLFSLLPFLFLACTSSLHEVAPLEEPPASVYKPRTELVIPLTRDDTVFRVPVTIGGVATDAILDTGASFTVCTLRWAVTHEPDVTTNFELVPIQVVDGVSLAAKTTTEISLSGHGGIRHVLLEQPMLLTTEFTSMPCLLGLDTLDQFEMWSIEKTRDGDVLRLAF